MKPRLLRIRRLVEYVGEPEAVLAQLARSLPAGNHDMPRGYTKEKVNFRVTVSQLGPAEFVDGDDAVTVAATPNAEATTPAYSLDTIKAAYWKEFHGRGEIFFDYFTDKGDPNGPEACTQSYWEDFEEALKSPPSVAVTVPDDAAP
jgi:hypothetical protein